MCDLTVDCHDKSDEDISICNQTRCNENEFICANGRECVFKSFLCDFQVDCSDSSDEDQQLCQDYCPEDLKCDHDKCLKREKWCDGTKDCQDGADEKHCIFQQNPSLE